MRTCKKCGGEKPFDLFTPASGCLGGRSHTCMVCSKAKAKAYREKNKSEINAKTTEWRRANPGRYRAAVKAWQENNPDRYRQLARKSHLKREYGITVDRFDSMLAEQGNCCAVCHEPFADKTPCVDHCHDTLVVRGLLCTPCNTALGYLKDRPEVIRRAAEYVEAHRGQVEGS